MILATVLAACGWLLMLPPINKQTVFRDAPMSQWIHQVSFDTGKDCEIYRTELGKVPVPDPVFTQSIFYARCIPAAEVPIK